MGGVVWRNSPAGPVKVPTCRRCSSSRARGQVVAGRGCWRGSRRSGRAAARASRAGRGRGCGPRAGGRPGAGRGPASCPASRVRPRGAACSPGRCPRRSGADRRCAAGTCRPAWRRRRPSAASMRSSPAGVVRRNRCSPGRVEITPRSSARLSRAEPVRAGDHRLEPVDQVGADGGVAVGGVGVVADHEPLVLADLDLLDPQVRRRRAGSGPAGTAPRWPRASRSAASRPGCSRPRRRPGGGGSPAEVNPRSATQITRPSVQSRSSSLTWRISGESVVLPGQHHTRTGIPSRVTAIPTTTCGQVVAGVLGLAVRAEPGLRRRALGACPPRSCRRRWPPPVVAFVLGCRARRGGRAGRARPARRPARSRSRCWWCRRRSGRLPG